MPATQKMPCRMLILWLLVILALRNTFADTPDTALTATAVVRTGAPGYYTVNQRKQGVDYDFIDMLAQNNSINMEVITVDTVALALEKLQKKKAHLAIGFIAVPPDLRDRYIVLPAYNSIARQVLYHYKEPHPKHLGDIPAGRLEISNYPAHRSLLAHGSEEINALMPVVHSDVGARKMFALLDQKFVDYTLGDSGDMLIYQHLYPRIQVAFDLPGKMPVAWLARTDIETELLERLIAFFRDINENGVAKRITNRYFQHTEPINYGAKITFLENADALLTKHKQHFIKAAQLLDLDWQLLAALSYQESHWNNKAKSPSHAKGLMMLTTPVIKKYGVTDPFDAGANVTAGGRYLLSLRERLPPGITEPDRTWFALAAYAIGMRFVLNARTLAERAGKNPDWWMDVREFFRTAQRTSKAPLRSDVKKYVHNILRYRDLIVWLEEQPLLTH